MKRGDYRFLVLASLALGPACDGASPKSAHDDVARVVAERTGARMGASPDEHDGDKALRAIDRLLAQELDAQTAVQVALLGNAHLRARLEELSFAQADLVEAGTLANPTFSIGRTAWEAEHIDPNLFMGVEQSFLSLLTLPFKKRVAAAALEAKTLAAADEVLALASDVRSAFFNAQAAAQMVELRRLVNEAAEVAFEIAKAQAAAGNLSELALTSEATLAAETRVARARAEGEATVTRERLTKLMGLWGARAEWSMRPKLAELPAAEPAASALEELAVQKRLDVASARAEVEAMTRSLSLAEGSRWVGTVNVSVDAGRLRGTHNVSFGPTVAIEIPLFDQRRAQVARLEAYVRQARSQLEASAVDVRSDVRSAHARVLAARRIVEAYGRDLVPLRERSVKLSQEQYDAMLLGVNQLLQAKRSELDAYREHVEALRDYWLARSDLERALGMREPGEKK